MQFEHRERETKPIKAISAKWLLVGGIFSIRPGGIRVDFIFFEMHLRIPPNI